MTKTIRDIKLTPKTEHGSWAFWKNDWTARAISVYGKKIKVKYIPNITMPDKTWLDRQTQEYEEPGWTR